MRKYRVLSVARFCLLVVLAGWGTIAGNRRPRSRRGFHGRLTRMKSFGVNAGIQTCAQTFLLCSLLARNVVRIGACEGPLIRAAAHVSAGRPELQLREPVDCGKLAPAAAPAARPTGGRETLRPRTADLGDNGSLRELYSVRRWTRKISSSMQHCALILDQNEIFADHRQLRPQREPWPEGTVDRATSVNLTQFIASPEREDYSKVYCRA